MKVDCPKLAKKNGHKERKESKSKKVYVAWDDNEVSSFDSESDESDNLALMASHHSGDDEEEVSNEKHSYDNDS